MHGTHNVKHMHLVVCHTSKEHSMRGHVTHKAQHRRIIIIIITTTTITDNFTLQWCTNHCVKFCLIITQWQFQTKSRCFVIYTLRENSPDTGGNRLNTQCQVTFASLTTRNVTKEFRSRIIFLFTKSSNFNPSLIRRMRCGRPVLK